MTVLTGFLPPALALAGVSLLGSATLATIRAGSSVRWWLLPLAALLALGTLR